MTQEEKQLLLKDLCGRSLYNVKCKVHLDTKGYCLRDEDKYCDDTLESVNCKKQTCTFNKSIGYNFGYFAIEEVKPYLRPMSSMTEEEEKEYNGFLLDVEYYPGRYFIIPATFVVDWLNAHYFDYHGLIEKGLALEAPERMYKNK